METVGDLCVLRGEITLEWKIKDFFPLSDKSDERYDSPHFYFSGNSWQIGLYPNCQPCDATEGWIGLYIFKESTGHSVTLDFSLTIKTFDEKIYNDESNTYKFDVKGNGWGWEEFISRSEILKMKSELSASNDIIVMCNMKSNEPSSVTGSFFRRLKDISDNLKTIFKEGKRADCKLKFKEFDEENISAHRMILETRSPVFAAMFKHDTKENKTGEVLIEDIEKNTMKVILEYMYTGDMIEMTTENALSIYIAADKYDIKDIKEIYSNFIIRNLSVEGVCDVIKFAYWYNEDEIGRRARQYFKENVGKILETDNWKTFAKENHNIVVELFETVVKALLPK